MLDPEGSEQQALSLALLDIPQAHSFNENGIDFFNSLGESG